MAQDPSEYWRELESYSLSDPELEHENERDNFSDEGEAETTEQETLDSDSNDDVPRWCREEIRLLKTKAGTSGAATRKRKSPASAQELPPPPKSDRRKSDSGVHDKHDENDYREMKHLLQKLCKKVESNERYLKEIQQKDRW